MAVEGIFRGGRVELLEPVQLPAGWEGSRVLIVRVPGSAKTVDQESAPSEQQRQAARQRLIEHMHRGYNLGGPPYPSREEIHDRGR